jgi:ABC-2 type transport system permease protein
MLRQIWTLSWKEFRLWSQKVDHWVVPFLLPLLFVGLMGSAFAGEDTVTVAVYAANEDSGDRGREVLQALRDSKHLDVEVLASRAEADRLIGAGKRMAALVIPAGFSDALLTDAGGRVEAIVDPAYDEKAKLTKGLAKAALVRLIIDAEISRALQQGMDNILQDADAGAIGSSERTTLTDFLMAGFRAVISKQVLKAIDDPQIRVVSESAVAQVQTAVPAAMMMMVPGFGVIFCFFLVTHLALAVVEERQAGTLPRLLSAPVSRPAILISKALPYFLLAFVQLVLVFIVGGIIFRVSLDPLPMGLVMLCTAATVAGLGIMIAALARTEGQAGGLTIVLILVLAAIGGAMGEATAIPVIRNISPHYWAMTAFQDVMARGGGLGSAWMPCGILLALAAVMFVIGAVRFRFE